MRRRLACAIAAAAGSAAAHQQSVLDSAGPQALHTERLWWWFLWITTAIFVTVVGLAVWGLMRRRRGIEQEPLERVHIPSEATEKALFRNVSAGVAATVLILFGLLIAS